MTTDTTAAAVDALSPMVTGTGNQVGVYQARPPQRRMRAGGQLTTSIPGTQEGFSITQATTSSGSLVIPSREPCSPPCRRSIGPEQIDGQIPRRSERRTRTRQQQPSPPRTLQHYLQPFPQSLPARLQRQRRAPPLQSTRPPPRQGILQVSP